MKTIITDIDECVLSWHSGFQDFIIEKGITPAYDISKCPNLEEWLNDIPNSEVRQLIEEFNTSPRIAQLKVGYMSEVYIPLLHAEGYDFIALTSCGRSDITVNGRIENIERYFPDIFSDIICIDLGESKLPYLEKLPQDAIWVEDKYKNAIMGIEQGHQCFLMNHTHNEQYDDPRIIRVDNWEDIHESIHEEANRQRKIALRASTSPTQLDKII